MKPKLRPGCMRGFFFTVMALALLSFMLLSVQLWVRTFEQSDARASQRFKGEAMRIVLSSISDKAISDFANASAFYALHRLVNYSAYEGLAQADSSDPRNNGTGMVEKGVYLLMRNGTFAAGSKDIVYTTEEMEAYTFAAWQKRIRSAANVLGFNASFSEPRNFSFRQIDHWTAGVSFQMDMDITDFAGTMRQNKTLYANATISLSGFLDPYIFRNDMRQRVPAPAPTAVAQRQVFRNPKYNSASDVAPRLVVDQFGSDGEGYGWFYGPITNQYPDQINESALGKLSQYILVHGWDDSLPVYADLYGAVIVTDPPVWVDGGTETIGNCVYNVSTQSRCLNCIRRYVPTTAGCPNRPDEILSENRTDKPMIVVTRSATDENWLDSIPWVYRAGLPSPEDRQKFVLIDNEYALPEQKLFGSHRLYDITALRDMAICGFYVPSEQAPSFFQRMLAFPPSESSHPLGIETFVVGQWAGGKLDQSHDGLSRLDWEFYSAQAPATQPARIKGMPGCKSVQMCDISNTEPVKEGVGKFRLSIDAIKRYGVGKIACNSQNSAPCDK
ncbi:MAG: hypothetical protein N3E51_01125 [Candidatus Micrarchaeota archaeon]|nr:hypothetical protein [Candidatus Micrarchaeota archaeon]